MRAVAITGLLAAITLLIPAIGLGLTVLLMCWMRLTWRTA